MNEQKDNLLTSASLVQNGMLCVRGDKSEVVFDIFDDITTINELPKIKQSEFNALAKKVLENIATSYSQSWHSRPLKDEEFPDKSICDKCTGCGTFKIDGEDKDCVQDKEQGWCYHRYQDAEEFGIEVETELESIYGLLGSEIVPDSSDVA